MVQFGTKLMRGVFGNVGQSILGPQGGAGPKCWAKFVIKIIMSTGFYLSSIRQNPNGTWSAEVTGSADPNHCGTISMTCQCLADPPKNHKTATMKNSPAGPKAEQHTITWWKEGDDCSYGLTCHGGWGPYTFPKGCPQPTNPANTFTYSGTITADTKAGLRGNAGWRGASMLSAQRDGLAFIASEGLGDKCVTVQV